jgi:quercetin dioxygenase-like cupin family protein
MLPTQHTRHPKEDAMLKRDVTAAVNPAEETIRVARNTIRFLVAGEHSNGSAALLELTIPAGAGLPAPPHSHDGYEETVYGLEGISTWTLGGEAIAVGPGQALCIPRGAVHAFANQGDGDARVLVTFSPAGISPAFFREMAAVIDAAAGVPPDRAEMGAVLRRHGATSAPPEGFP